MKLGNYDLARTRLIEALNEASKANKTYLKGFILGHLANVEIKLKKFRSAKSNLEKASRILTKAAKKEPKSLYIQIWLSGVELATGEYWFAKGDKKEAERWAEKAMIRANKYDLKVRKLDAKKLFKKLGVVTKVFVFLLKPAFVLIRDKPFF